MSNHTDQRLNDLFKKARCIRPDMAEVEDLFETRLLSRLHAKSGNEATLSVWTWRLVPVLTVFLLLLMVLNTFIEPKQPPDILGIVSNGYTQTQVTKYLTGE